MKVDYDWGSPPKPKGLLRFRAWHWLIGKITYGGAPMCHSNHYRRESFHDDGSPRLF